MNYSEIPLEIALRDGMLFDDGLPTYDSSSGYNSKSVALVVGITLRQVDYWTSTGLVQASVQDARGSGSQRLYSFRDILVMKVIKSLLDVGVSLQKIRGAVEQLHEVGVHDLAQATLMSDGKGVYLCSSHDEIIDLLNKGQGVFGLVVGKLVHEVEAELTDFEQHRAESVTAVNDVVAFRIAKTG
ncbi:MerR family transcriptional regulator [Canibacter sp. lx-72]|uniref:MerR family transcriptional regulator n=1 Tax=Canibacter zhuwentaonis TaxID=2837491 RepID=UPI001BDD99C2|nr:MerR family transcriptional regulator [Canibacter zhuwentaonis]MBT1018230.1 MerR family transcriptional regulator [Canibacter zhuwentaonis]